MSIRILTGYQAARAHIARLRTAGEMALPASTADRLRAVFGQAVTAEEAVARIVADVRRDGDAALRDYTQRIDGVQLEQLAAGASAIEAAYHAISPELREALDTAAGRIRAFHEREPHQSWLEWDGDGSALGQIVRPLRRVGIYVPGGAAAYPSSLLMTAIPAQVAGVGEIVVTTPPGPDGRGSTDILAAAHVLGVQQVFLLGGAQAVAALAYGTESVPRADKVCGAGGLFVTLAKKHVYGDVGIDGLYGPTETLLIADAAASPRLAAADLLAQAEHDPLATALLVTPSEQLARAVQAEVARQLPGLERRAIIEHSLAGEQLAPTGLGSGPQGEARGAILVVAGMDEALALANEYAPEHLCLLVADPWSLVGQVQNAGGIFVGESSSEALGDYAVGPSHVMPTMGTARFASPLHVGDFLKVTSLFAVSDASARRLAPVAQTIARAEGLTAHAAAVAARYTGQAPPLGGTSGRNPHGR